MYDEAAHSELATTLITSLPQQPIHLVLIINTQISKIAAAYAQVDDIALLPGFWIMAFSILGN